MALHLTGMRAEELFQAAKRLAHADRYDSAIEALNQAIAQAPQSKLYDYRGVILSLIVQNEAALESFAKALELAVGDSERAEIYFHRGLLYGRDQLYEQALLDFTRACRLNRFDPTYREARDSLKEYDESHDSPSHLQTGVADRGEQEERGAFSIRGWAHGISFPDHL
jgi:tetratricopeptide (TPR) repeat protein